MDRRVLMFLEAVDALEEASVLYECFPTLANRRVFDVALGHAMKMTERLALLFD